MNKILLTILLLLLPLQAGYCNETEKKDALKPLSDLLALESKLRPVFEKVSPEPTLEYKNTESLIANYQTRKYIVHSMLMNGDVSRDAHEETGPDFRGFMFFAQTQPLGYMNQAVLPQTFKRAYWTTTAGLAHVAGSKHQIYWGLSYGAATDKHVLESIKKIMEDMHLSDHP